MMHEFQLPEWFRMPATAGRSASKFDETKPDRGYRRFHLGEKGDFWYVIAPEKECPWGVYDTVTTSQGACTRIKRGCGWISSLNNGTFRNAMGTFETEGALKRLLSEMKSDGGAWLSIMS